MSSVYFHDSSQQAIAAACRTMPQSLLIIGKKGSSVDRAALEITQKTGTLLEKIIPKKRQTNGDREADEQDGTISIDDIRQLHERTRSKFTHPQIVIIKITARGITQQAQNAFLKLLEEPQANIHFILTAHSTSGILPTILSRCQKITIAPTTQEQSEKLLNTLAVADPTKRARILFIAAGLPQEIEHLATDEKYYENRIGSVQDAKVILEGSYYTRLVKITSYKDKRPQALELIDDAIHQLQVSLKKSTSPTVITQIDTLIDAHEKISANANIQLALAKVLL